MKVIDKINIKTEELSPPCKLKKLVLLRIDPEDKREAISRIYYEISNLSWINKFDKKIIQESYRKRSEKTIVAIKEKLDKYEDDQIISEIGEYFVSEISRQSIVSELNYLNIPLAELWKEQKTGNPGFDFHSESNKNIIIYGESKYDSRQNAYNRALKQIVGFIVDNKHIEEVSDLINFVSPEAIGNIGNDIKGFAAAFSSYNIETNQLIKNILENENFKSLKMNDELILIAVNM